MNQIKLGLNVDRKPSSNNRNIKETAADAAVDKIPFFELDVGIIDIRLFISDSN